MKGATLSREDLAEYIEDSGSKRFLEYLPDHLRRRYIEGLNDPELLHTRREVALIDVRIKTLLENLDREVMKAEDIAQELRREFPDITEATLGPLSEYIRKMMPEGFVDHRTFGRLEQLVDQYEDRIERRQITQADASLRQLFRMVREGRRIGDVWDDIEKAMDRRRRFAESEQKRLREANQTLTVERVITLLGFTIAALRESVIKHVLDQDVQRAILTDAQNAYSTHIAGGLDSASDDIVVDGERIG